MNWLHVVLSESRGLWVELFLSFSVWLHHEECGILSFWAKEEPTPSSRGAPLDPQGHPKSTILTIVKCTIQCSHHTISFRTSCQNETLYLLNITPLSRQPLATTILLSNFMKMTNLDTSCKVELNSICPSVTLPPHIMSSRSIYAVACVKPFLFKAE